MPKNAVLPTAAPLQAGAGLATIAVVPGELPDSKNDRTEPSESVTEKF